MARDLFFTLGWVAKRHPAMIRRIAEAGHEIASHGYDHARVFTFDRKTFAEDIRKARAILEDLCGRGRDRLPRAELLDRPAHPLGLCRAGRARGSPTPPASRQWRMTTMAGPRHRALPFALCAWSSLVELPVTTAILWRAARGGRRRRLFPGAAFMVSRAGPSGRVNRTEGRPAVFYFHPWEIDPDQPRVGHAPLRSRLRHYTGLARMADKLRGLVHEFRWGRMDMIAHREAARAEELPMLPPVEEVAA